MPTTTSTNVRLITDLLGGYESPLGAAPQKGVTMLRGSVDLSQAEKLFGIPAVPVWPERNLDRGNASDLVDGITLASFHGPHCNCGRPFGITYDLHALEITGNDPNETLLHECTHAWQYYCDPEGSDYKHALQLAQYGYWDAPYEREARDMARRLDDAGVRVWFPA